MKEKKIKLLVVVLLLPLIASFFFQRTDWWFILLQVIAGGGLLNLQYQSGKLEGSGQLKTDFSLSKGEQFRFLRLVKENEDREAFHYFFLEIEGKEIYCGGYLYPRLPKEGEIVILGKNPHEHADDVYSFTPLDSKDD